MSYDRMRLEIADALLAIDFVELFARSGVTLHDATNFETVLAVAKEQGTLGNADAALVQDWLNDPRGWAQRHGIDETI